MSLNVNIDASGMFYRSLFTVGNYGVNKNEKLLDSKKSQSIFMRKLATDFASLVRDIDNPTRILVCLDSSSWRKSIPIEDGGYKGDREEKKQESPINWTVFYDLIDKFATLLGQKGYIISKIQRAEADDLLYLWSRYFNNKGENVVSITGDRDILQTVQKHPNGSWTVCLDPVNKRKKISLTQETLDSKGTSCNECDIFSPDTWSSPEDVLEKLISSYDLNIVEPTKFASIKVIMGDGGDAVPGVVTWPNKDPEKKSHSITDSNFRKITEAYPGILDCSWEDFQLGKYAEEITSVMCNLKKIEVDVEKVKANMERNCKLVVLSDKIIPQDIQDAFNATTQNVPPTIALTNADSILNGSEWWSGDKTAFVPKSFDLFGDM